MIFRKGGILRRNTQFKYGENNLEIVNKFTYLGIVFSTGGALHEAQQALSGQALKAIFILNKYVCKFVKFKPKHVLDLFDKLIRPILNYSAEVWGFTNSMISERVHLQFCKRLLGVKQCTQNNFIYGDLGRTSFLVDRHLRIIKYWLKICYTNERKYIRKIYDILLTDLTLRPNKVNWVFLVRDLLSQLGFHYVWLQQGVGNEHAFLSEVSQRLNDNFIQNWSSRIHDSSRAISYKHISVFGFNPYLEFVNVKKFRIALSRLRMSSHRLAIESGRWTKPTRTPLEERLCYLCNTLKDECHNVLECPAYSELRCKYIHKYYWKRPSMSKFTELMTTDNKPILQNLACFVQKSFALRNELLYT